MKPDYTKPMSEIRKPGCAQMGSQMTSTSSFSQVMAAALERRLAMAKALRMLEPPPLCEGLKREQGEHPPR